MPCYEVNLITVKFKAKHKEVLKQALKDLNMSIYKETEDYIETFNLRFNFKSETADVGGNNFDELNRVKRQYSLVAVKAVAKKKRWAAKETGNFKLQLAKY